MLELLFTTTSIGNICSLSTTRNGGIPFRICFNMSVSLFHLTKTLLYIWLVFTYIQIDCIMLWSKFRTGNFLSDKQLCNTSIYAISLHYSTICYIWQHERRYKSNRNYGALTSIYANFFLMFTPLSADLSVLLYIMYWF